MSLTVRYILLIYISFLPVVTYGSMLSENIEISADELIVEHQGMRVTFAGNVSLGVQNYKLETEQIIIYYKGKQIDKILVPSYLKVVQIGNKDSVRADGGVYDHLSRKLWLEGNVELQKDQYLLKTDKMLYQLKNDKESLGA